MAGLKNVRMRYLFLLGQDDFRLTLVSLGQNWLAQDGLKLSTRMVSLGWIWLGQDKTGQLRTELVSLGQLGTQDKIGELRMACKLEEELLSSDEI